MQNVKLIMSKRKPQYKKIVKEWKEASHKEVWDARELSITPNN